MTVDQLIDAVIGREGNYSNNPADRGGPTRWGVKQQVARAYGYAGDMAALPRETAVAIYRQGYWTLPGFDKVAAVYPAVAAELFDMAVNMGAGLAAQLLQRMLNVLNRGASDWPDMAVDGQLGPVTAAALAALAARRGAEGGAVLLLGLRGLRTARYVAIAEGDKTQEAFAFGWLDRQVRSAAA